MQIRITMSMICAAALATTGMVGCARKTPVSLVPEGQEEERVIIADFEAHPNRLGGDVGVYGDGEPNWDKQGVPHSWYYEASAPDYSVDNVAEGLQSFRLINGEKGLSQKWASFNMNLGPTLDSRVTPIKIRPLNVSSYNKLVFWVKGAHGGEQFRVIFRDAHAPDYLPQARVNPMPDGATTQWSTVEIPLSKINWQVDLKSLVSVGLEFGQNIGNRQGAMLFIDNFMFVK